MDSDSEILPFEMLGDLALNLRAGGAPLAADAGGVLVFRRCGCACWGVASTTPLGMLPNAPPDDRRLWSQDRVRKAVDAAGFHGLAG